MHARRHGFFDAYLAAKECYDRGGNIMQLLSARQDISRAEAIEIAYSLQSGTYTALATEQPNIHDEAMDILSRFVGRAPGRVFDFGIGEGTAWCRAFSLRPAHLFGADLSHRRLQWVRRNAPGSLHLFRVDGWRMPFVDGAFDLVTSFHAVEPNDNGTAAKIVAELARVTGGYLAFFEPNAETATPEMRRRMESHGYNTVLWQEALALPGFDVVRNKPMELSSNPLNATSCLILRRKERHAAPPGDPVELCRCPMTGKALQHEDGMLVEESRVFSYPVFREIAFLNRRDAVFIDDNDI